MTHQARAAENRAEQPLGKPQLPQSAAGKGKSMLLIESSSAACYTDPLSS